MYIDSMASSDPLNKTLAITSYHDSTDHCFLAITDDPPQRYLNTAFKCSFASYLGNSKAIQCTLPS